VLDSKGDGPGTHRLVGWKAIAGHLSVSQRTAMRWAEHYRLPVFRVPRGDRPVVHATAEDLDRWWESAESREARGVDSGGTLDTVRNQNTLGSGDAVGVTSQKAGDRKGRLVLGLVGLLASIAVVVGYLWYGEFSALSSKKQATPPRAIGSPAHGQPSSEHLVELRVAEGEHEAFTVTVAEGEMVRLDTETVHLGLQSKVVENGLKLFIYRLRPLGAGESADYIESRIFAAGAAEERLKVDGTEFRLLWSGEIPADIAAARQRRMQCCMVCGRVTVCGRVVSGGCGGCQGDALREPVRNRGS
jgi:hypothetical protein